MLIDTLHALPKVELHRHLEGSVPIPLAIEWSKKYELPLPKTETDLMVTSPLPLNEVLDRLRYQQNLFQDIESVETLTYEILRHISEDNIKLIELRFSPGFMAEPKQLSLNAIMEATLSAKERAEQDFDIAVGYILIASRDLGLKLCEETINLAIRWKDEIIGVDLAGPEETFPPELFEKPFQRAKEANLHITIHSGEVSDPKHIITSIEKLGAERIGHGVQSIHNKDVLALLKTRQVPLELCPTSNWLTKAVGSFPQHPLKKFLNAGVLVTINSDDPSLFDTSLSQEYEICIEHLGFSLEAIKKTILTAYEYSFIKKEQKIKMWDKYFKYL